MVPCRVLKLLAHRETGHRVATVAQIPLARWNFEAIAHAPHAARYGGFITVTRFDSARFKVAPAEASVMDPQQRLVLELTRDGRILLLKELQRSHLARLTHG